MRNFNYSTPLPPKSREGRRPDGGVNSTQNKKKMKINKNNAAILLCLFFHINVFAQQKASSFFISKDTIISKLKFCDGVIEKGFSSIGNIWFSQDYEIRDSFSIFINKDKIPDKIVILSPIVLRKYDLDTSYSDCVKSKFARRLFVVLIGIGDNNYKIGLIKDDLILNPYEVAWHDPYIKTKKTEIRKEELEKKKTIKLIRVH